MTLEPTQIAGFNQWFDAANATTARFYGIGGDWQASKELNLGAEATRRDYKEVIINSAGGLSREPRDETIFRLYGYWKPRRKISTSAEFTFDRFNATTDTLDIPMRVDTISVPLSVRYFLAVRHVRESWPDLCEPESATVADEFVRRREIQFLYRRRRTRLPASQPVRNHQPAGLQPVQG